MSDDPRRNHPGWEDPAPKKRRQTLGVRLLDSLRPSPKSEKGASQDPWVQRIGALAALVATISAAGWGGAKMTERDVPTEATAEKLAKSLAEYQQEVTRLHNRLDEKEKQEKEQEKRRKEFAALQMEHEGTQDDRIHLHAQVIRLLNGRVSPTYNWPSLDEGDWTSGPDNLHRHNRSGGKYPGTKD